jgi:hypothetical protein
MGNLSATPARKIIRKSYFDSEDKSYGTEKFRKVGNLSVIENGVRREIPAYKVKEWAKKITRSGQTIKGGKGTVEGDLKEKYKLFGTSDKNSKRNSVLKILSGGEDEAQKIAALKKIEAKKRANIAASRITSQMEEDKRGMGSALMARRGGYGKIKENVLDRLKTSSGHLGVAGKKYVIGGQEYGTQDFRGSDKTSSINSIRGPVGASAGIKAANLAGGFGAIQARSGGFNKPGISRAGVSRPLSPPKPIGGMPGPRFSRPI